MGSHLSPITKAATSSGETGATTPSFPSETRSFPQRNGMCYFCSFGSRASWKLCNFCGPDGMKSSSKYLDLPGKQYAVRPSLSISSRSMRKFIQFGISDDEERYLLYQAKHGDSPSEQSDGIENGKGQETHPKVAVIEANPKLQTPKLVFTAAEGSNLTMDMRTWAVLNLHIGEDQAVDLIPTPPAARSQANHGTSCLCSKCRNAAEMGDYFKRAMMKNDGQSTVRVFTEVPSSDPNERALLFPTEHTISTKKSSDSLHSTYMAQGGELQDLRWDPLVSFRDRL